MSIVAYTPPAAPPVPATAHARERYAAWALAATFLMAIVIAPLLFRFRGGAESTGDGDVVRQGGYVLIFLATIASLRITHDLRRLMIFPASLVALFGLCFVSILWAIEPAIAVRRLLLTVIVVVTIFLAIHNAGLPRSAKVMRWVLVAVLVFNYASIVLTPAAVHLPGESGNADLVGNWRGLLPHKNFTGVVCAVTVLFFVFGARSVNRVLRIGVIAAAGYFLWRTQSKTSIGVLAPALLVGWMYVLLGPRQLKTLVPAVVVLTGLYLFFGQGLIEQFAGLFEQPDAFTGRGQIWPALIHYATVNPLTGAGFGSFWNIGPRSPIFSMSYSWISSLGNGHNGYLDVLVQIGFPGLILAVLATVLLPGWKLLSGTAFDRQSGALLISILLFCAGNNFTESSMLDRDVLAWIFQVFALAGISRLAFDATLKRDTP